MTDAASLVDAADALLVDLDGTLVDSSGPVMRAWTAFAVRNDLDPATVLEYAHGRPSRETVRHFAAPEHRAGEEAEVERAEVSDPDGVTALPGARALLESGRRLAIVTSCSRALASVRLRAAGLPIPAALVTGDHVRRGKPDPECFRLGAERLGLATAACLVLEDAPAGIAAGRAAGAPVLALRTTHADADLIGADAILDDLAGLHWIG